MSRVISAKWAIQPKAFESISDAVAAAQIRSEDRQDKLRLINGKIVLHYIYSGKSLAIELTGDLYLVVTATPCSIAWEVYSTPPDFEDRELDDTFLLEFSKKSRMHWNWKSILDEFLGKQIAISPSNQFLFLHVRGDGEYMFNALLEQYSNDLILFFSKS